MKPLLAELQDRAVEELDYQLEAAAQREFAAEYGDDPDFVVPDVVAAAGTCWSPSGWTAPARWPR